MKLLTIVTIFVGNPTMLSQILKLLVDESHTHALSRDIKHLSLDGQVCFCRRMFCDAAKPRGCISCHVCPLRGINKTAWGVKLILTADLVYQVSRASLGHPLMAHHCHVFECLLWPAYSSPPTHPYRLNPHYYSCRKKLPQKPGALQ